MTSVSITTFNVNSLKARLSNVLEWLDAVKPDVVLFQETKCVDDAFPRLELEERGYNLAIHGQKTYNGVAICSKFPLDDVIRGLPGDDADDHARYIEAVASVPGGAIRVASAYVPNGQTLDSEKYPYKMKFYERLRTHWQRQLKHDEIAVLGGDFNVAPDAIDVHAPKEWENTVLFHLSARQKLRALCNIGLYDAFRVKHPQTKQFSWWDYRAGAYEHGDGLRIDHLLLSGHAVDVLQDVVIDETPRGKEKPSDHTPVIATLKI